jgi:SAM-dependent methyltransferase
MTAPPKDHARGAYEIFAGFYDVFTEDHREGEWTATLEALAHEAGLRGRRLLDVGCGTGKSFLPMLARGYEVTACDISPAMLAEARRKARGAASLHVADMRSLPRLGEFDLVWCLIDALNYLHTEEELRAAFSGVRANLAPHGVFLFDVNTLGAFRRFYSSLIVRPSPERVILLDGRSSASLRPGGAAEVWIDRLEPNGDGSWRRDRSVHHHRHHGVPRLERALRSAGLEPVARLGAEVTGAVEPEIDELRHTKIVFIARGSAPSDEEGR